MGFLRAMIKRLLFGFDPVEREKQRAAFMDNPPPCGAFVSYAQNTDDHHGEFIFKASDVVLAATKIIEERSNLVGMHATLRWLGQRDESNREPTSVPKILIHFDHIVHELIALRGGRPDVRHVTSFFLPRAWI